jgi:hypothetical protein
MPVAAVVLLANTLCRCCRGSASLEVELSLRPPQIVGVIFLCLDRLFERRFTAKTKHAAIVECRTNCGNVPQDCGAVACAEDVVLAAYKEAAMAIAATLQVIL